MENTKTKYETAKDILEKFQAYNFAFKVANADNQSLSDEERFDKALDWYLEQYKKVLNTLNDS